MQIAPGMQAHSSLVQQQQDSGASEPWLKVIGSHHLVRWLADERVSLALTTYQLGKLPLLGHKSGEVAHRVRIENKVHELYDVVALQGVRRPAALGFMTQEIQQNVWFAEGDQTHRWTAASQ